MANPKIIWDDVYGWEVSFPSAPTKWDLSRRRIGRVAMSDGVVHSVGFLAGYHEILVEMAHFSSQAFHDALVSWWSWAEQGRAFSIALDADETADTFTTAAATVGDTALYVDDETDFEVGGVYVLRDPDGSNEELVEVFVTAAGTIGLTESMKHSHLANSTLRSQDYYPRVVVVEGEEPIKRHYTTWSLSFRFKEDRG